MESISDPLFDPTQIQHRETKMASVSTRDENLRKSQESDMESDQNNDRLEEDKSDSILSEDNEHHGQRTLVKSNSRRAKNVSEV